MSIKSIVFWGVMQCSLVEVHEHRCENLKSYIFQTCFQIVMRFYKRCPIIWLSVYSYVTILFPLNRVLKRKYISIYTKYYVCI
jgi:hypothetical protein